MRRLLVLLEHLLVLPVVAQWSRDLGKEELCIVSTYVCGCNQRFTGNRLDIIFFALINTVQAECAVTHLLGIYILIVVVGILCVEQWSPVTIEEHIK